MLRKFYDIPWVGYWVKAIALLVRLPTRMGQINTIVQELQKASLQKSLEIDQLKIKTQILSAQLSATEARLAELELLPPKLEAVMVIRREVAALANAVSQRGTLPTSAAPVDTDDDAYLHAFYRDFEDRFRGSRELVLSRCTKYVRHFTEAGIDFQKFPVLDIGCGRGEWLETLQNEGIKAKGIDINFEMIEYGRLRAFEVEQADVLSYLQKLPDGSLGAVTGFHIVEHLPFPVLVRVFDECLRVLRPQGLILFETPNPENLRVGSCNFYLDPTHRNPIPPEALRFIAEQRGFHSVKILRYPDPELQQRDDQIAIPELRDLVAWTHRAEDYAILGRR